MDCNISLPQYYPANIWLGSQYFYPVTVYFISLSRPRNGCWWTKQKQKKNPATKAAKTKWGILQGKAGVHGLKLKNSKKTHTLRCNHHPQWVSQFSHGKDCDWGTIWEAVAFWKRYELGVSRIRSKFLVGSWEQHLAFLGFHFLNGNMMTKMIPINRDVRMMKATWDRKTLYEI